MPKDNERKQDIEGERKWHERKFYIDSGHWTSHRLFASRQRHWLKNDVQKIRFYGYLYEYIRNKPYSHVAIILMAPVGSGDDLKYLHGIYNKVYGIDISNIALSGCPGTIIKKEGDILTSGYEDESFDIVICCQFLHHVHGIGFEAFIKEFFRLLRKGGVLAIMEPSSMYPFSWLFGLLNKIIGNVTGKVEDEKPVFPSEITKVLKNTGFERVHIQGLSYNHARFPCGIQLFSNLVDWPLRWCWCFKFFAESIGWFCEKPEK